MKRTFLLAIGVLVVSGLACERSGGKTGGGGDPAAQLLVHTDRMIGILRANESDPEKATRELAAYEREHGAELARLKQAMADFMKKTPMKAAAAASVYGRKSTELEYLTAQAAARVKARDGATP